MVNTDKFYLTVPRVSVSAQTWMHISQMAPVPPKYISCRCLHSIGMWLVSLVHRYSRLSSTPSLHVYSSTSGQPWQWLTVLTVVTLQTSL